mmetsp:Transcript_37960/g.88839  ORF Transcript_37960/g.88839 Transcript_37960/m.88839 type:complete len:209 (-) Transcript_37960:815-1441(-)
MTKSTIISRPRAATSVATRTRKRPLRKAAIVFSRIACGMSPWRGLASNRSVSAVLSSSHSALVEQKTMTRPLCPPYMAMTSLIDETRSLTGPGAGIARWRTCDEAFTSESPTRSISLGSEVMYPGATCLTHEGSVAEKRQVCRSLCVHSPRMVDMSSAKPMSSIWSASSSVTKRVAASWTVPRSAWSLMRPGVPTRTSTPVRSDDICA